jgi:hypothetical protein
MSLVKTDIVDQINVLELGQIQVRTTTRIIENGTEISKSYHRHVLAPGDDLTGQDERVVAVANAVWTPEVIAAYQESIAQ